MVPDTFISAKTVSYVGKLFEREVSGTLVQDKHYIYAGNSLVAIYTGRNNGINDTKYVHTDHLGSINVLTGDTGNVLERLSFDPHGKRRQTNGQDATATIASNVNRGFTRHEHDDEVGLINMNARLYDPVLGRFITPDSMIEGPAGQGLNRYSYVLNNPLTLTDPTGHWSLKKSLHRFVKKWGTTIIAAAAAYYTFGYVNSLMQAGVATTGASTSFASAGTFFGSPLGGGIYSTSLTTAGGAVAGASSGFVSGGILSGNLQGAWKGATAGAISGGLFTAANNISSDWNAYGKVAAKATAGGLSNDLQGRNFGDGFRYNFLYYGAQEFTDYLARKSGLQATDPNSGKLDTVGTRANLPNAVEDESIFGKLGLRMRAEGEWRNWYRFPALRTFVVDVSKVHDAMDFWMYRGGYYAPTGMYSWIH